MNDFYLNLTRLSHQAAFYRAVGRFLRSLRYYWHHWFARFGRPAASPSEESADTPLGAYDSGVGA